MRRPMGAAGPPRAEGRMEGGGLCGHFWALPASRWHPKQSTAKTAAKALTRVSSRLAPHASIRVLPLEASANDRPQIDASGSARGSREIQELGKVGSRRRDRHAELRAAGGHRRRGAPGEEGQGDLARLEFR